MNKQDLFFYDLVPLMAKLIDAPTFEDAAMDFVILGEIKEDAYNNPAKRNIPFYWGVGRTGSQLKGRNANWGNWCHKVYEIKCDENMMWSIQEVDKGWLSETGHDSNVGETLTIPDIRHDENDT